MQFVGEVLAKEDTKQMQNHFACISPCGRFVACTGIHSLVYLFVGLTVVMLRVYS